MITSSCKCHTRNKQLDAFHIHDILSKNPWNGTKFKFVLEYAMAIPACYTSP
jgi:hypothetical protein